MKHNPPFLTLILLFLFLLQVQTTANAQSQLSSCDLIEKSDDFLALADRRAELLAESQQLKDDIAKLEMQLPTAMPSAQLEELRTELGKLEAKPSPTGAEEQRKQALTDKIQNTKTDKLITDEITDKRKKLDGDKDLLLCIQKTIPRLTSPDQKFRGYMSGAFAGLIAIVIGGFFILAYRDEIMRRAIFSGETGIQFLTLFSLVIAIILFGIINILEGKELAALLGGLSGYILGRTTQKNGAAPPAPDAPQKIAALQKFVKDLNAINVTPSTASLSPTSKAQQLTAEPQDIHGAAIKDDNTFFIPEWVSSDPNVATVDQLGLVSRVGPGNAQITATFANVRSNSCAVTCI
ncbi:MAG TPA: Ig-like domain-containing protein [Pyrinomonadaceae bacterium]|jgi:uncharacterized protein YjdB